MYIPIALLLAAFITYAIYSTHKYNRQVRILDDLIRSYDQTTTHLVRCHVEQYKSGSKERKEAIEQCAKAILNAAGETVTTKSLMGTTDILSMCRLFNNDFTMREPLTTPYYEFEEQYGKELEAIEATAVEAIRRWVGE